MFSDILSNSNLKVNNHHCSISSDEYSEVIDHLIRTEIFEKTGLPLYHRKRICHVRSVIIPGKLDEEHIFSASVLRRTGHDLRHVEVPYGKYVEYLVKLARFVLRREHDEGAAPDLWHRCVFFCQKDELSGVALVLLDPLVNYFEIVELG